MIKTYPRPRIQCQGEPSPTQKCPQVDDFIVLKAYKKNEVVVVCADEMDMHAAPLNCGEPGVRRHASVFVSSTPPPHRERDSPSKAVRSSCVYLCEGYLDPPSLTCLMHTGPGFPVKYSLVPWYWPWSPVGWTVTFNPVHTPSPLERRVWLAQGPLTLSQGHRETSEVTVAESLDVLPRLSSQCLGAAFIRVRQIERDDGSHRCWS